MKSSESAIHGKSNPLYDSHDSLDKSWYHSINTKRQVQKSEGSRIPLVLIILGLITDILLLLFILILEYFLRCSVEGVFYESQAAQTVCHDLWKNIFPLRKTLFSCADQHLNYRSSNVTDFDQFYYKANISSDVIFLFCFITPILVFIICELLLYGMRGRRQVKSTVNIMCRTINVPYVIRRIYRFIAIFLFGALSLMLFVDVVKLFVGRLRPTFLSICRPNCETPFASMLLSDSQCNETRAHVLKEARTSFPSLHSALSMYTAVTIMIYLHAVSRLQHGKFLILPFVGLSFFLLAVCCALSRHGHQHNWWTDILAGQIAGIAMAIYMGLCVSKGYKFEKHISNRKLHQQIKELVAQQTRSGGTKDWHHNKLGYFNADSLYNLRGSPTELQNSALYGLASGGESGGYQSSNVMPRINRPETAAHLGERTALDVNQKIVFRQSRCSSSGLTYLSTGNAAGSPAGATVNQRGSIGPRNSLRNSRAEAIPVPLLSISSTSSTGLQGLTNPSQQS